MLIALIIYNVVDELDDNSDVSDNEGEESDEVEDYDGIQTSSDEDEDVHKPPKKLEVPILLFIMKQIIYDINFYNIYTGQKKILFIVVYLV
jgi:hypothetical protein